MIHGLDDGAVAVLTKMHHAAVDGVSGAEVCACCSTTPRPVGRCHLRPPYLAERFPSDVEMLGRGMIGMARHPVRALRASPPPCLTSTTYRRSATCPW